MSRRSAITRLNGASSGFGYDLASRLIGIGHDLASTANDVSLVLQYTPVGQPLNRSHATAAYAWTVPTVNRSYTRVVAPRCTHGRAITSILSVATCE